MSILDHIAGPLASHAYVFSDEAALHEGIAKVLDRHGFVYEREKRAGRADRFDFLIDGRIVIEAKVDGSLPAALRQVDRYLQHEDIDGAVIASANQWARCNPSRTELRGKPVAIVHLRRVSF